MTLFSLLRLNNDSMRILSPYYRHEQERVEKINNLKKTTQSLSKFGFKTMFLQLLTSLFDYYQLTIANEYGHQCHKNEMHRTLIGQFEKDVYLFTSFTCHSYRWSKDKLKVPYE